MATVKGGKEAKQALRKVSRQVKAGIRKGSRAGAKIVQAKAKELAPKRSGRMVKTIKVRALPRSRKWIGAMARLVNDGDVFYGGFVNYGTKRIRGRRFLNDAAGQVKDAAIGEAKRIIRDTVLAGV